MPRAPHITQTISDMPAAVFSPVAHKLRELGDSVIPLHVGDTWLEPCVGARAEDLRVGRLEGLHRYPPTQGLPALVDAVVDKVRGVNRLAADRDAVLVTAGATGALAGCVASVVDPGDEVLILSPFWPLFRGIVRGFRGVPVEVPFYDRVDGAESAVQAIRERIGPRTVAIYVSTPSNPTGVVIPEDGLRAIAELAREEELWILSDEVYEDYVYEGAHVSIGRFAPERTLSVFSFSKAYGMAGNRTGYLVAPPELVVAARKVSTHTVYTAPTVGQYAALGALRNGETWLAEARTQYAAMARECAGTLGIPAPAGSTFLFLDVARKVDERGVWGFLEDCLDDGFALAPGSSCGEAYATWVRLCFTAAPPEAVRRAVSRLAGRLAG